MFKKITNTAFDIFFPPNETEKILRVISAEELFKKCQKDLIVNMKNSFYIFKYKDPFIKDAIYELKNNKNKDALKIFSQILAQEILNYIEENLLNLDYKIPITFVPQHKKTFLNKGYNQVELLVDEILKHPLLSNLLQKEILLKKVKQTKPQHLIKNKKQRLKNLKGVFESIQTSNIKNKDMGFLIDDIQTTGATLKESRRVLMKSGFKKVICFTIAH